MFEVGELGGLHDAREGAAAGAEDPGAGQGPEGSEAGPSEARLESKQERGEGTDQEIGHAAASLSFIFNK